MELHGRLPESPNRQSLLAETKSKADFLEYVKSTGSYAETLRSRWERARETPLPRINTDT